MYSDARSSPAAETVTRRVPSGTRRIRCGSARAVQVEDAEGVLDALERGDQIALLAEDALERAEPLEVAAPDAGDDGDPGPRDPGEVRDLPESTSAELHDHRLGVLVRQEERPRDADRRC